MAHIEYDPPVGWAMDVSTVLLFPTEAAGGLLISSCATGAQSACGVGACSDPSCLAKLSQLCMDLADHFMQHFGCLQLQIRVIHDAAHICCDRRNLDDGLDVHPFCCQTRGNEGTVGSDQATLSLRSISQALRY